MKTKIFALIGILSVVSFASCKKSQQGASISYQVKTVSRTSSLARIQSGVINWTSGYANSKQIEFEAQNSNGAVHFQSEALQKIDLFSPITSLGNVSITPGVYNQVEFQIELVPTVSDAAMEIRGTYNNVPVIFRINSAIDIDADKASVTITDEKSYTSLIALDLAKLTMNVSPASMDAATKDANGVIIISATSNTSIYNVMLANWPDIEEENFQ